MIHSAILKLTLSYLGIIMLLSISFSTALYQLYRTQLEADLSRMPTTGIVRDLFDIEGYELFRAEQVAKNMGRIQQNLVLLNVAMLGIGGVVSYLLARRTLQPIVDALEAQSRFTADASHELRTPLAAIQAETEVALRNPKLTKDEAKQLLVSNLEEVAKLKRLSEGLLTLARSDGRATQMDRVSLKRTVAEVLERLTPVAKKKSITIAQSLDKVTVRGDKQRLADLVSVLVDNAIKYSPAKTTISVALKRQRKAVVLTVADQGYGIKGVDLPHIFDRFYRSDMSRSKEQTDGYGLGLSIARQTVEAHEGTIDAKSTPGKGSTFTVRLPLER